MRNLLKIMLLITPLVFTKSFTLMRRFRLAKNTTHLFMCLCAYFHVLWWQLYFGWTGGVLFCEDFQKCPSFFWLYSWFKRMNNSYKLVLFPSPFLSSMHLVFSSNSFQLFRELWFDKTDKAVTVPPKETHWLQNGGKVLNQVWIFFYRSIPFPIVTTF